MLPDVNPKRDQNLLGFNSLLSEPLVVEALG